MFTRIILVGKISRIVVAKFTSPTEAMHCARLLQAMTSNPDNKYFIKEGRKEMKPADSFSKSIPFLTQGEQLKCLQLYTDL